MKRFENKTTVVKGFVIDKRNGQSTPFETVTSYVRATDKAAKMIDLVALGYATEDIDNFIVVVSECINPKTESIRYSNSKLIDFADGLYEDENEANKAVAEHDSYSVKKVNLFWISGEVWLRHNNDGVMEYMSVSMNDNTPLNLTKQDMRAFIKMSAEQLYVGWKAIGADEVKKDVVNQYVVISDEALQHCIIKKRDNDDNDSDEEIEA